MPRMLHHDAMVRLFLRALHGGARRTSLSHARWDISGRCRNGYEREIFSRPPPPGSDPWRPEGRFHLFNGGKMTMSITLITPCRKCDMCRKARSFLWQVRTIQELKAAPRTWFGTLTMSPVAQFRMLSQARHEAHTRAIKWEELSYDERFRRVANTSLKEVTKYIKRVRKNSGVPLRYICVTEQHKTGLPHFHLLIHEVELRPVTHKILSQAWVLGFEKWRLVDLSIEPKRSARYICKYLTKDALTRIRASQHYGQTEGFSGNLLSSFKDAL